MFPFVRLSLFGLALTSSTVAVAFPDLIRKGYQTCFGCHVSPNGGGAINDYGRLVSVELSTWGREDEARNIWGLANQTDPLLGMISEGLTFRAHADFRYLNLRSNSQEFTSNQQFMMQTEGEFVLDYKNTFGLAYSVGKYYGSDKPQSRKAYVYGNAGVLRVRFGRFMPAYSIMMDDHTLYVRNTLGFNQGQETVNAEVSAYFKWIEVFLTERIGAEPRFVFDWQGIRGLDDKNVPNDIDRATVLKVAVYPTGKLTLGASVLMPRNNNTEEPLKYGAFAQWAFYKGMYVMGEFDVMSPDDSSLKDTWVGFGRYGFELFKGFMMRADYEVMEQQPVLSQNQIAGSLVWIPRPHFELQFEAAQTNVKDLSPQRSYQLVYHLWL